MSHHSKKSRRDDDDESHDLTKRQQTLQKYVISHHDFKRLASSLARKNKLAIDASRKFGGAKNPEHVTIKLGNSSHMKVTMTQKQLAEYHNYIIRQQAELEKYFKNTIYAAQRKILITEGNTARVNFVYNEKTGKMVAEKAISSRGNSLVYLSNIGIQWFKIMYDWIRKNKDRDQASDLDDDKLKESRIKTSNAILDTIKKLATAEDLNQLPHSRRILTSSFVSASTSFFINAYGNGDVTSPEEADEADIDYIHRMKGTKPKRESKSNDKNPPAIMRYHLRPEWVDEMRDNLEESDWDTFASRVRGIKRGEPYVFSSSYHLPPILRQRNTVSKDKATEAEKKEAKQTNTILKSFKKEEKAKKTRRIVRLASAAVSNITHHKAETTKARNKLKEKNNEERSREERSSRKRRESSR